jgi:hypothetical protein
MEDWMGPIELTAAEQDLWDQIDFPGGGVLDSDRLRASSGPAHDLAGSLLERDAIPPIRWRYFTDPELNVRGHGKSRLQVFERNGTRGDAVLRHPHFLKYLRYFVLGPDLPASTSAAFTALIDECAPVTSGDVDGFCELARCEVRSKRLERRQAAEEFFKLALELELDEDMSRMVRDSVMEMRSA